MAGCTFPLFRNTITRLIGDLCIEHDEAYTKRIWRTKVWSDFNLTARIIERGYFWLGIGAFLWATILGTPYWLWKKYMVQI